MARPKKDFDKRLFKELCEIQCTKLEICAVMELSDKTLDARCKEAYGRSFSEVYAEKREGGKASLRRKQWLLADKNATMALWLGKQYLGQTDNPVVIEGGSELLKSLYELEKMR